MPARCGLRSGTSTRKMPDWEAQAVAADVEVEAQINRIIADYVEVLVLEARELAKRLGPYRAALLSFVRDQGKNPNASLLKEMVAELDGLLADPDDEHRPKALLTISCETAGEKAPAATGASLHQFGSAPPEGVKMLGRWHGMNGQGFAISESSDWRRHRADDRIIFQIRLDYLIFLFGRECGIHFSLLGFQIQRVLLIEILELFPAWVGTDDIELTILQKVVVRVTATRLASAYKLLVALSQQRLDLIFR
jgi:hypothetical protein